MFSALKLACDLQKLILAAAAILLIAVGDSQLNKLPIAPETASTTWPWQLSEPLLYRIQQSIFPADAAAGFNDPAGDQPAAKIFNQCVGVSANRLVSGRVVSIWRRNHTHRWQSDF